MDINKLQRIAGKSGPEWNNDFLASKKDRELLLSITEIIDATEKSSSMTDPFFGYGSTETWRIMAKTGTETVKFTMFIYGSPDGCGYECTAY